MANLRNSLSSFPQCCTNGQKSPSQTIVSHLEGTLLISHSFFPYYMLLAFEAGSPLRAFLLLVLYPLVCLISRFASEATAIRILIFVSTTGLKFSEISAVSKAVLPKFLLEDLHPDSYRVLLSCKHRYVVTSHPKVMVEYFLRTHLQAEKAVGTELLVTKNGYCTGIVAGSGVLMGKSKAEAVRKVLGKEDADVGLGSMPEHRSFLSLCKKSCFVLTNSKVSPVPRDQLSARLIFHDGRLVIRPTPFTCLAILLWSPLGLLLGVLRMTVGLAFPELLAHPVLAFLGVEVRVKGAPPLITGDDKGVLFVCTHRTCADPTYVSIALRRRVRALTYSVSKITEMISPIRTTRLTRNRDQDANIIIQHLMHEDLVICPEGTTCREPYLLRFSSLFGELTDRIVPVAARVRTSFFHGTTARGSKSMDVVFFLMNPRPSYEIIFLDPVPLEQSRSGGKTSIEVANYVQKQLADALGFQCTNLTRKHKYVTLAGHDGTVKT